MPRRQKNIVSDELFDILTIAPAWFGPALAITAFLFLQFVLPLFLTDAFGPLSRTAAPLIAGFIGLSWVAAEIKKWERCWLLDKQTGIDSMRGLSWRQFENLVGEAYRRRGFGVEYTGDAAGDGGVDLVLQRGTQTILVQCKQWKTRKVGVTPVRELVGVVASRKAQGGILVTSGQFTEEAREFAKTNPIELIDGPPLAEMIAAAQTHVPEAPSVLQETPAAPPTATSALLCPQCNSPMVRRTAGKGPNAGKPFWGCPNYPRCRGVRNIA